MNTYRHHTESADYGSEPFVVNISRVTRQNRCFRTALWTGEHLQLTLMSIPVGGESAWNPTQIWINFCGLKRGTALSKWDPVGRISAIGAMSAKTTGFLSRRAPGTTS